MQVTAKYLEKTVRLIQCFVLAVGLVPFFSVFRAAHAQEILTVSHSADSLPCHDVLELSFKHDGIYDNNFFDVDLLAIFNSPDGTQHRVNGFFYHDDLWKVRFRPDQPGRWTYIYFINSKNGYFRWGSNTFECTPVDTEGSVRNNPKNSYRWIFDNGQPYFPIGLQDCIGVNGSQLEDMKIDGEQRSDENSGLSPENYFLTYGQAGFNLFRFSQRNCSYLLFDDLDHYREAEGIATDVLLSLARKHGFRVMFGFFGFYDNQGYGWATDNPEIIAKEQRFIDYSIARWGVYVDFWELLNESGASDEWTTLMADYIRSIDPDHKPISTNWEKSHLPTIDINAPHWYEAESELQSDLRVVQQATTWKQAGKPVIVGEHGNTGMNWDPLSGLRMRLRSWTALFQEISFVFWNTSWAKNGMFNGQYTPGGTANIYLGPEERGYIRVLQDFSTRLDPDIRMAPVETSAPNRVRAYGLHSGTVAAAYLHHYSDHTIAVHNLELILDLPDAASVNAELHGEWIEPATGNVLACVRVPTGRQTLDVPPFIVDLALLITSETDRLHSQCAGTDFISSILEIKSKNAQRTSKTICHECF